MGTEKSSVTGEKTRKSTAEEIQENIHHTRQRMDRTVEELAERFQSLHFIDDAMDFMHYVKEHTDEKEAEVLLEAGRQTVRRIVENPLPSALIVAGAAWLLLRGEKAKEPSPAEREPLEPVPGFEYRKEIAPKRDIEKSRADRIYEEERTKDMEGHIRIRDKRSIYNPDFEESEKGFANSVEKTRERLVEFVQKHPLAVGAGAIALGILGGITVPRKRKKEFIPEETAKEDALRKQVDDDLFSTRRTASEGPKEAGESTLDTSGKMPGGLSERSREEMAPWMQKAMREGEAKTHSGPGEIIYGEKTPQKQENPQENP